ncbi:type III secretion system inner membrane ring subunit SctD [Exilibacterium tricleocarpae]|nr:type III secretion system inner membrane ring subunit SctD [Exilibacterium tricleocarpae]
MGHQASQHLLKIFSGPHIGAELLLDKGAYDIGHSDDCDIVLNDETIVAKHARIVIDDVGHAVTVSAGAQAWLNGLPLGPDTRAALGPYETVALGTTYLAIGRPGGDWSQVRFPGLLPVQAQNDAEGALGDGTAGKFNKFFRQAGHVLKRLHERLAENIPRVKYKKYWRGLGGIAVLVVTGATGVHVYHEYLQPKTPESAIPPAHRVAAVLAESGTFTGVRAAATGTGGVLVHGYIADAAQHRALRELLEPLDIKLDLSVKSGAALVESAQSLIEVLGFPALRVIYQPHGKIAVEGFVTNRSQWENAKLTLFNDLAGLQAVDDSGIQDVSNRRDSLRARLNDQNLSDRLVIASGADGTLKAQGVLSQNERRRWRTALKQFRNEFGDNPSIETAIRDTSQMIKEPIVGVRIGQLPYIVTEGGGKYLQGAVLPSGYKVKSIYSNHIIFSKDGVDATYQLD